MPSTPRSRKLLDPHTRHKLVAELRAGPTRRKALERLHISESTFYRELERSAELRELVNGHGKERGHGHRNGDGTALQSTVSGENHKGRERRRRHIDASDPGAAAEDLPLKAPWEADASSASSADSRAEPVATAETEVPAAVEPRKAKASKSPKGPKPPKPAERARKKPELATVAPPIAEPARKRPAPVRAEQAVIAIESPEGQEAATAPSSARVRRRKPRGSTAAPVQETESAGSVATQAVATPALMEPSAAPAKGRRARASAPTAAVSTLTAPTSARAASAPARRRQATGSQQAYWLPPVLVLAAEIVVGLVVGASPVILLLVTGSMVAVLYVVRRWGSNPPPSRRRSERPKAIRGQTSWPPPAATTSRAAPIAVPARVPQPTPLPIDNRPPATVSPARRAGAIFRAESAPTKSTEQPSEPVVERGRNDLRWLWNSIGRDPRPPRPPRRDGR